ncbi:odorant receptor 82a-like isoform X2 [Plutella xylostella]|uniref:odorant receptor 82a-like isoform X2 n=2 Tax=Plutella xylostella TaxID=51655 RepID=UPI0020325B80|nr:odorant receptor 82a-like isoform X2 [Plutella xylostella]
MGNSLRQSFNKHRFDFEAPVIHVHDFHPQIRVLLSMNGLFFNNKDSLLRFVLPAICICLSVVATTLELLAMWHALQEQDSALFTEAFAYCVIIGVVPFLYLCNFMKSDKIYALVDGMDKDFVTISKLGEPYRSNFLAGQLNIWKCGYAWLIFVIFVASMYILLSVVSILYYCLFVTHDEGSHRPLVFPVWLPHDDPHRSPNYELFLGLMYLIIIDFATTFTTYVYIVFHLLLHCYFLINMVMIGLEHLFDDVDDEVATLDSEDERYKEAKAVFKLRMKNIVDWHNAVFTLISNILAVYGTVMAYQVIFSSMVMCLMAFYISVQLEQGNVDICITLLCVGALLQLWIPCYLSSLLRSKGYEVCESAFYSGWHHAGLSRLVHADLRLVMLRAQKPVTIQVTMLPVLGLETFSSILSTAYSYFNMLRQTSE